MDAEYAEGLADQIVRSLAEADLLAERARVLRGQAAEGIDRLLRVEMPDRYGQIRRIARELGSSRERLYRLAREYQAGPGRNGRAG